MITFRKAWKWLKFSAGWIYQGKRNCSRVIEATETEENVLLFKSNMWEIKFKYQPDHWVTKSFNNLCDERIDCIKVEFEDI